MIVYGIKNCDTVKRAVEWLKSNDIAFEFHDYKKLGISDAKLKEWCIQKGQDILINKKGTTWRKLTDEEKDSITIQSKAIEVMKTNPSVIKRPIIEKDGKLVLIGFDESAYQNTL